MKYKLIEHNSEDQRKWGNHDDTKQYLEVGNTYEAEVEQHSWHTKLWIHGKKFNSVCFEPIEK